MQVTKGEKVIIKHNRIFKIMGYDVVTGEVFVVFPNGKGFAIKCKETGCLEAVDYNDGIVTKVG